jgi:hypothetical protein
MQTRQLVAGAVGYHLDAAVGIVADPPCNLQDVRLALDEPAEADALDAAADEETTGEDERLGFLSSHRAIAEVRG